MARNNVLRFDFALDIFMGAGTSTGAGGAMDEMPGKGGRTSTGLGGSLMRTLFPTDAVGGGGNHGLGAEFSGAVMPLSDSESLSHFLSGTKTAVPRLFFPSTCGGGEKEASTSLSPRPHPQASTLFVAVFLWRHRAMHVMALKAKRTHRAIESPHTALIS